MNQNISIPIIVLSLLAMLVPLVVIFVYFQLIPTFEANLQKMLDTARARTKRRNSLETLWKWVLCRTDASRAYFQFVYRIADREREFKLKVYPSLGIGLVFPFIFIFSEVGVRTFEEVVMSNLYFCIYLMHIFIGSAVYTFQFSDSFKGAWIFTMSNDTLSSQLYAAVMKVFLAKLYFPIFILVGVAYYLLFLRFSVVDLAIVFVSAVIQALLSYKITVESKYPFSQPYGKLTEKGNTGKALLLMLLTVPFVILHFISGLVPFGLYVYFIILCVAIVVLWRWIFSENTV